MRFQATQFVFGIALVTTVVGTLAAIGRADDALETAIQRDRNQIHGTWRVTGLVVNGNQATEMDARKLTVVNGSDGRWSVWSEGKEVAKGTSTFDPTKTPKTIDFVAIDGEANGKQYFGIYELGEKKRKMCFSAEGKERPTEFVSVSGSEIICVTFEREAGK